MIKINNVADIRFRLAQTSPSALAFNIKDMRQKPEYIAGRHLFSCRYGYSPCKCDRLFEEEEDAAKKG